MKVFKEIIERLVKEQLSWTMGILGIPVLVYGAYFQTVGFTYITVSELATPVLLSAAIGYAVMKSVKKSHMNEKQYFNMLAGYEILFAVDFVALYCTPSIPLFYISLCLLTYSTISLIMALFDMSRRKNEKEALEKTKALK